MFEGKLARIFTITLIKVKLTNPSFNIFNYRKKRNSTGIPLTFRTFQVIS